MYNYPKLSSLLIILISIIIIIGCAFHKSLKEGLTNINNVILLGDSVLNNSNYVPSGKSVGDILNSKLSNVLNLAKDGATINDLYRQLDDIPIELDKAETFVFISAGGNDILNKRMELNPVDIKNLFDS
jgi:lysophospholipase L1-like esterase